MDVEIEGRRANARVLVNHRSAKRLAYLVEQAKAYIRGKYGAQTAIHVYSCGDGFALYFVKNERRAE